MQSACEAAAAAAMTMTFSPAELLPHGHQLALHLRVAAITRFVVAVRRLLVVPGAQPHALRSPLPRRR